MVFVFKIFTFLLYPRGRGGVRGQAIGTYRSKKCSKTDGEAPPRGYVFVAVVVVVVAVVVVVVFGSTLCVLRESLLPRSVCPRRAHRAYIIQ